MLILFTYAVCWFSFVETMANLLIYLSIQVPSTWTGKQEENLCFRSFKTSRKHALLIPWNGTFRRHHDCWMGRNCQWNQLHMFIFFFFLTLENLTFPWIGSWTILCRQRRRKAQGRQVFSRFRFTIRLWCTRQRVNQLPPTTFSSHHPKLKTII